MVVISIFIIAMLCVLWWVIKCYFGNTAATFIVIAIITILVFCLNSIANEPTPKELHIYNQGRKGVGYR